MLTLDTNIQAALVSGRVVKRELVEFRLGGGVLRYVKDNAPVTWDGETWLPGAFISVSEINRATGLSASSFTVTLSASPDDDLTPDELKTYYTYNWNDKKVVVRDLYLDADTGEVVDVQPHVQGNVERTPWKQSSDAGAFIVAECVDRSMDFSRRNARLASKADQATRNASDKFFDHAALIGQKRFWWGRKK